MFYRDKSLFDPKLEAAIVEVNKSLYIYGPRFLEIAAGYKGSVVLGEGLWIVFCDDDN